MALVKYKSASYYFISYISINQMMAGLGYRMLGSLKNEYGPINGTQTLKWDYLQSTVSI